LNGRDSLPAWLRRRRCFSNTKNTKEAKNTKRQSAHAVALGELCLLRVLGVEKTAPAERT
jgi:hypothetical protein